MKNHKNQIARIQDKLYQLKKSDPELLVSGADSHKYELNNVLSEDEIMAFENKHKINLPEDYKAFLLHLGNGGAGPYYGLEKTQNGIYEYLDNNPKFITDLSKPFTHVKHWNLNFEEVSQDQWDNYIEKIQPEYFHPKWAFGMLRISNFGCGVYMGLVVKGNEYGTIWVDDRANYNGIFPDPYFDQKNDKRTSFLEWYEMWLDRALQELKK